MYHFFFKVGQVRALEAVFLGKDVIGVLLTGYGKSLIFQLTLDLIAFNVRDERDVEVKGESIVIIVCPLDSLIENHAKSLNEKGIHCVVLRSSKELVSCDADADNSDSIDHDYEFD